MAEIAKKITSLLTHLEKETNEEFLLEEGQRRLNELRQLWRASKSAYSTDDVSNLKKAASQLNAVQMFCDEEEEFEYISDKDDANDVIGRLYPIVEALDSLAVAGRVQKEIRELLERMKTMPTSAAKHRSAALNQAIQRLTAKAPNCRKGHGRMVLREGNGSHFWGCSTFPKCWSKRWLTKNELAQFGD